MGRLFAFIAGLGLGGAVAGLTCFLYYRRSTQSTPTQHPAHSAPKQVLENREEWEVVTDENGDLKKIIVHRKVHA